MRKMKLFMVFCYLMSLVVSIQTYAIPASSSESFESSEETDGEPHHHVKDNQQKKMSQVVIVQDPSSYVNLDDDGCHQTVNDKDQRSGYVAQVKYPTKDPAAGSSSYPLLHPPTPVHQQGYYHKRI